MDDNGDVQSGRRILKNFVNLLLVVFVWSLFVGTLSSCNSDGLAASTSMKNLGHVVAGETGIHYPPVNSDTIYTAKRRVPSGPDPIHNRHVGESGRLDTHLAVSLGPPE